MSEPKPLITPDDQMIVVPDRSPKGWRVYSVQPQPSEARMKIAARALSAAGWNNDWWIQGRGVLLVDCRAAADRGVVAAIEQAWNAAALDEQLERLEKSG
jgi:hypothetical protein